MTKSCSGLLLIACLALAPVSTANDGANSQKTDAPSGTKPAGTQQLKADLSPAFVIDKQVPIETLFGKYHMVVELGALKPGVTGKINVELVNHNDVRFQVKDMEIGCRCTSARFLGDDIAPFSSSKLEMTLTTPTSSRQLVNVTSIKLISKTNASLDIDLVFRYEIEGMLTFAESSVHQEVDPERDRQTIMVPFLLTDPVKAQDIQFDFSPHSDGIAAELADQNGKTFVKVVFEPVFFGEDSHFVDLVASDPSRTLSTKLVLMLRQRRSIEITPLTLRFQNSGDDMVASCMVRYRPKPSNNTSQSDAAEPAVSFEATVGSQKLGVRTQRLVRGIYRVYLSAPTARLVDAVAKGTEVKPCNVQWHIVTPEKAHAVESSVFVVKDVSVPQ